MKPSYEELESKLNDALNKIKASQEQESVAILHPYGDSGWLFLDEYCPPDRNPLKLYAAPVIPPDIMKLIRDNAELTKLLAEAKSKAVPEGWQLVPIQLNSDMGKAFGDCKISNCEFAETYWEAMLSAAPQPETDRGSNE